MAMGEVIVSTLGGIIITTITAYSANRVKKNKKKLTKDDIVNHSLFATLYAWQIERVKTLTTDDVNRTKMMQQYAKIVISSVSTDLKTFVQTLSNDNPTAMAKVYLSMVQNAYDALYKSGIPDFYIQRTYEYSASLREGIFLEIEEIDQSDVSYFEKVNKMCGQVKFLVKTTLTGLPLVTSRLNGELTSILGTWQPTEL